MRKPEGKIGKLQPSGERPQFESAPQEMNKFCCFVFESVEGELSSLAV
jgi:hypothetical protein